MSWEAEFPCHGTSSPPRRPQTWRKWSDEADWPDQYEMNTWVRIMVWYVVKTIIVYIVHSASLLKPSSLGKSCSISVFRWEKTNLPGPLDRAILKAWFKLRQRTKSKFKHRARRLTWVILLSFIQFASLPCSLCITACEQLHFSFCGMTILNLVCYLTRCSS